MGKGRAPIAVLAIAFAALCGATGIDRKSLVTRHNVTLTQYNATRPMQVGNGEFAFGMDITGLQTFVPFNTMSQWGWHTGALPRGQKIGDFQGQIWDTHGRPVRYPVHDPEHPELSGWLAANPHRINLGRIGMALYTKDGLPAQPSDLKNCRQELDMWRGIVTSRFEFEGQKVRVITASHPTLDAVAVRIDSPLIAKGQLSAYVSCPGNNPLQFANFVGDWTHPGTFEQKIAGANRLDLRRQLDNDVYHASLSWKGKAAIQQSVQIIPELKIVRAEYGAVDKWLDVTSLVAGSISQGRLLFRPTNALGDPIHGVKKKLRVTYLLRGRELTQEADENEELLIDAAPERSRITLAAASGETTLNFVCAFSPKPLSEVLPTAQSSFEASENSWLHYWKSGGAIDLSGSSDPRWKELERRIVLSQYLMKVNEAGSLPPQESGLVNNGWFGRFHLEMVWWHATHWALWNRWPELNRSMDFYRDVLPSAIARAKSQGYEGARWPKCIGPGWQEWPHPIHAALIWQQPHPIFFAELDYRAHPTAATLAKWKPIVEATADFLASYAHYEDSQSRYVLGPPLHIVSENTDVFTTQNPTFELSYWRFGLRTAQQWRKRQGLPENPKWQKVLKGLSQLPQEDGVYVTHEGVQEMWTKMNFEHPGLIGAYGMLPGDGVDRSTMARTFAKVGEKWEFHRVWGWDLPMLAMSAARLNQPDKAVDYLLHSAPTFQFDELGYATGGPFPYFPSNGGLLYAVAMMAAGWDGAPKRLAPGFPSQWKVRYEGLALAP